MIHILGEEKEEKTKHVPAIRAGQCITHRLRCYLRCATSAPRSPHGARNIHVRSRCILSVEITCIAHLDGLLVRAQATISSIVASQFVGTVFNGLMFRSTLIYYHMAHSR